MKAKEIKDLMKQHGIDRFQLANHLQVSHMTPFNWLRIDDKTLPAWQEYALRRAIDEIIKDE